MLDLSSASGNVVVPKDILERLELKGLELSHLPNQNRYSLLKTLIGEYYSLDPKSITLGNGCDAVLERLAYLYAGDNPVTLAPTFGRLFEAPKRYAKLTHIYRLKESKQFSYDQSEHIKFMKYLALKNATSVWVCSPNNPTGSIINTEYISDMASAYPGTIFIIDEVFIDFLLYKDKISATELVKKFRNVIVVNSFSKTWGLSGLRLGFCVSSLPIARQVQGISLMFDVSTIAVDLGILCLREPEYKHNAINEMHDIRIQLLKYLQGLKGLYFVSHSEINVLALKLNSTSEDKFIGVDSLVKIKLLSGISGIPNSSYVRLQVPNSKEDLMYLKTLLSCYE